MDEMIHDVKHEFVDNPEVFIVLKTMLEDVEKFLYPNSIKNTKLSILIKIDNVKKKHGKLILDLLKY